MTAEELIAKFDDETLKRLLKLNSVGLFHIRKGRITSEQEGVLREHWADLEEIRAWENRMDPNKPDMTHPALQTTLAYFDAAVKERGLDDAYSAWTAAGPCACMGPRDGEPLCPCQMRSVVARYRKTNPA